MRKALFEVATGVVVNIIQLEDGANWQPPTGHAVVDAGTAGAGDTWDGGKFVKAPEPEPTPDPAIAIAAAAADVVTEIGKAISLTTAAKTALRDKLVTLVVKAQGG